MHVKSQCANNPRHFPARPKTSGQVVRPCGTAAQHAHAHAHRHGHSQSNAASLLYSDCGLDYPDEKFVYFSVKIIHCFILFSGIMKYLNRKTQ